MKKGGIVLEPKSRKGTLTSRLVKCWPLYVMLLPPIIYLIIFQYYPMYGAQIAFKDFRANLGIEGSPWVGFKYFIRFFESYQFQRIISNTLILAFYSILVSFPMKVILALSINAVRSSSMRRSVQMVTYMPHFISTVVMVGILTQFFNPRLGIISKLIQILGGTSRDLLGLPEAFSSIYVWSGIWQNCGWGTIIFLAALTSVDVSQHEAAFIDGANRFQRIIHIDFPAILSTAMIVLILDAGTIMNIGFEKVFLMQNGLNLTTSEVISTYVYKVGIGGGGTLSRPDFSYASAIGLFNSAVNFILVITVNKFSKVTSQASIW